MQVELDHSSLTVDGKRLLLRSGALHYFRLPAPELWRDRLQKMREAGLNAVDIYYPWNYHSQSRGDYEFSGVRDVDRLHDMIEEAGLYLIARPGPYICAELDLGGLPAWLLRERSMILRCRTRAGFIYSREFLDASEEWFDQIVPRFASRRNLLLVQIENEYAIPGPLARVPEDLLELALRWLGPRTVERISRLGWLRRSVTRTDPRRLQKEAERGQTSPYMRELYGLARRLGVSVPITHNDVSSVSGRQMDVDLLAVDRYPVTSFDRDWRDDPHTFDEFRGDAAALYAHRYENPLFYAELQAGWFDRWGGPGYERVREVLGPDGIDAVAKAVLAEGATLWNWYVFCGGVTWGYLGSPDVYTSYDYGAPIAESGATGPRYEAVRRLNEFLEQHEEELAQTEAVDEPGPWCPEHLATRQGPSRRFVFLRNPTRETVAVPTPESERSRLAPWETQIRVYGPDRSLLGVSPEPVGPLPPARPAAPPLPALSSWRFSGASPQIDPAYDDGAWEEIPERALAVGRIDIDELGVHYGFIWYRGSFSGPLDRLMLDARHCWSVWINGELRAAGDQFQNSLGLGPDAARLQRVGLRGTRFNEGKNVVVILVESLGHNKHFADDGANPRGIVRLDTGGSAVRWRFRGGLVRGEQGIAPVVAFEGVERNAPREVTLPHGWAEEPEGIGLFETEFRLEGVDSKSLGLGLCFDPGRGKANLYLNGSLVGRYWPERGPQQRFLLPWGVLQPDEENRLSIALWKRTPRAALGRVRLEPF